MHNCRERERVVATQIGNSNNFGNATSDKLFMCLRKSEPNGVLIGDKIRRLTPIECERLQGFPDNWTKGISDTQRYKVIGNAVSVPIVELITRRLYDQF